jgi:hypothetical protein
MHNDFDGFIVAESTLGFKRKTANACLCRFRMPLVFRLQCSIYLPGHFILFRKPTTLGGSKLPCVLRCNQSQGNFRSAPTLGVNELVLLSCPWVVLLISNANAEARICSAPLLQSWPILNANLQRAMDCFNGGTDLVGWAPHVHHALAFHIPFSKRRMHIFPPRIIARAILKSMYHYNSLLDNIKIIAVIIPSTQNTFGRKSILARVIVQNRTRRLIYFRVSSIPRSAPRFKIFPAVPSIFQLQIVETKLLRLVAYAYQTTPQRQDFGKRETSLTWRISLGSS